MPQLTLNDLQTLEQSGRYQEATQAALDALKSPEEAVCLAGAVFLVANAKYDHMGDALAVLRPVHEKFAGDFTVCGALAYAAWFKGDVELCRWASHRCIALNSENLAGYLRLGMQELMSQRPAEAFLAFSAGVLHCKKEASALFEWYRLSKALMQGTNIVAFDWEGMRFSFRLATYNGHALEAAVSHMRGHLCEEEELRYLREFVGHCDSVVEVGAAVGNHTLFFAKALTPKRIHVFDANAPAVAQTKENIALNCSGPGNPEIAVHFVAVGATPGRIRIFDQDVPVVRLDDEVKDTVDFIKIDVDGMEMQVLEGCRGIIVRDRPKLMIEVQNYLKDQFQVFLHEHDYVVAREMVRAGDSNYFIRSRLK